MKKLPFKNFREQKKVEIAQTTMQLHYYQQFIRRKKNLCGAHPQGVAEMCRQKKIAKKKKKRTKMFALFLRKNCRMFVNNFFGENQKKAKANKNRMDNYRTTGDYIVG